MYRVFIFESTKIANKLIEWFCLDLNGDEPGKYCDKVARIFLLWVNNHFSDFESSNEMTLLLDKFENVCFFFCYNFLIISQWKKCSNLSCWNGLKCIISKIY